MMFLETANDSVKRVEVRREATPRTSFLFRKIWLPKSLYNALPAFYVGAGLTALVATVYVSEWFWIVPHYLLFSAACIHMGLLIYRRRRHGR
jgi:hypothetical protein